MANQFDPFSRGFMSDAPATDQNMSFRNRLQQKAYDVFPLRK